MPYNGSGTFTLAQAAFVPSTPISSSAMNSDLSDIATNGLTNAVTKDGQTTITGPFKGANGSVGLPMYSFASDTNTGMYRIGADNVGISAGGTKILDIATTGLGATGALGVTGTFSVGGISTFSAAVNGIDATFSGLLTLSSTGYMVPPSGTTGQRPGSPAASYLRYNTTLNQLEYYNGAGWASLRAATDPPQASSKNLSIKVATNTTVTLAADSVITTDGTLSQNTAVSSTINLGTTGANALDAGTIAVNSWYAIWTIAKADGTTAGLASLSATAPTMPSGYTYKARVGWVQTINGSATLFGTWQFGRTAQYVLGLAQTGSGYPGIANGTTASTMTAFAVTRLVPPTASRIAGYMFINGATAYVSPNNAAAFGTAGGQLVGASIAGSSVNIPFDFILESTNVYYGSAGGTASTAYTTGWEDNI